MKFKVDEISSVISEEIQNFRHEVDLSEVGRVLEVGDGIARVYGLSNAMAGEQVEFSNGQFGQVFNLEEGSVGVPIFGEYLDIREGDEVRRTGQLLSVPCGEPLIGRVVDTDGEPVPGAEVVAGPTISIAPIDLASSIGRTSSPMRPARKRAVHGRDEYQTSRRDPNNTYQLNKFNQNLYRKIHEHQCLLRQRLRPLPDQGQESHHHRLWFTGPCPCQQPERFRSRRHRGAAPGLRFRRQGRL